jgi:hypothetical protein
MAVGIEPAMPGAISFAGAAVLASAFVLSLFFRRFTARATGRWRALSAGVTVAYVFVNIIPELEEHRPTVTASVAHDLLDAEKRIYLWALAGFVTFVGLSQFAVRARSHQGRRPYWAEIAGYSLYTILIGYLLVHREDASLVSLELFIFAMGLHLFLVDVELVERFPGMYHPWGRVLLAASVLVGWMLGALHALPDSFTSRLFAFVIGGVVVLSAQEELPEGGGRPFWWFAGGAFAYATLLMLI